MKRAGRILAVDDNRRWRELLSETLQQSGYYVDTAASYAEASQRLSDALYHLLILDIRLEDADEENNEGMDLLRQIKQHGPDDALRVIILSAFGTKSQMREAFRDHHVADFQSKDDFDDVAFVELVHELFAAQININLDLLTHWQQVRGPEQVMLGKRFGGARISRDTPELAQRAAIELDDLLCRLFYGAESLLVRPLVAGHSDAGVLWAQPFLPGGGAYPVVVKFGDAREIDTEYHHFIDHVRPYVGGGRRTSVESAVRHTPRLGGIVYSLLGATNDRSEDFGSFYRRADVPQITALLEQLFFQTCGAWYGNRSRLQLYDLTAEYEQTLGFTLERLEQVVNERFSKSVQGKHRLTFRALEGDRSFSNPILALAGKQQLCSTFACTTHGDFNPQNILVDAANHAWLIDFMRTGPGHILRDVALLESATRIYLLAPEEASLNERLALEEWLCAIEGFGQLEHLPLSAPFESPALAKAGAVALYLRQVARRLVLPNPHSDLNEYHTAALYQTLNLIRFYSLPMQQREHALLSASLLVDRLGL
jgi:CheY-like chemotaxis protein